MKRFLFIIPFLFYSMNSLAQIAPAAERAIDVEKPQVKQKHATEIEREPSVYEFHKAVAKQAVHEPKNNKRLKIRELKSEFGGNFLIVFGIVLFLAGIVSFFLFGIIGWWVVLTAFIGIAGGLFAMLGGAIILNSLLAGVGVILLSLLGLGVWVLGILGVGIYDILT